MVFTILSVGSVLFPFIIGLTYYCRNNRIQNYFLGFIFFSILIEITSSTMVVYGINNHGMFKVFLGCEFLFFTWFYYKVKPYPFWFWFPTIAMMAYLIFETFNSVYIRFPLFSAGIFFIMIFLYFIFQSIYVLTTLLNDNSPSTNPVFWIASARLIYFLCIFSIYSYTSMYDKSFESSLFSDAFTIINGTSNILCNVLFANSFLCTKNQI